MGQIHSDIALVVFELNLGATLVVESVNRLVCIQNGQSKSLIEIDLIL